ncbi:putative leucine-rich repeat-containing protein DDB_G0290503 [Ooceraea biroi]|uniref:putative leucine-rich repeat-containing protein DDB_G0290503 n=1 Tax=Ooceraea biroi TaxID=2015173 RepID=UPI0005B8FA00|nr:putative leucine-rich repeat-containing protein DDB_G0290503 [Ooceraea biroi]XP_011329409.1 putative leucine-rich repeat-containing protein DDB_G0290503 [Ooceraea biroi]
MQEDSEKPCAGTQSGKFIDTLIVQWMKRTGSNISLHQTEEMQQAPENPSTQEPNKQQALQHQEQIIQNLKRKLKESQEVEASLSSCLEAEVRNKEEIQTKLNGTWESIETIAEYFNYISETLASFQQHHANLSSLYDNVILKQQETIQKLQANNEKMKDQENQIAHLRNKSLFLEERLQEATVEEDKLRKQLENSEYELQLQKNELANTHAQEKLKLVKEQQRLLQEYESRLQTVEKEKCDVAKLAAQLENKLQIQEEKMRETLTEQTKLRKQLEDTEREFCSQKNATANAHAGEKKILVEKQQQLLSAYESLQSQLKVLEQNKSNTAELMAQKDVLLSKLQDENSTYKNQIEVMKENNNEMYNKCEASMDKQNMYEKELNAKSERIQNLEAIMNAIKQRESNLINDVNRIEKKLTNEMDYAKNLETKLNNTQKELQFAQEQNDEMQKTLDRINTTSELDSIKLQQQLKTLQREKEEVLKRENTRIKSAEILYENMQAKYKEVSALKNNHETQLVELKKTIDHLNEMNNDIRKENNVLNMTLTEVRADNSNLRNNHELLVTRNEELQGRLRETTEALQMRSIEDRKQLKDNLTKEEKQPITQSKSQQKKNAKRKYGIRFDPDITEITEAGQCNVSTSVDVSDDDDEDDKQPPSQPLNRSSTERESQKEQEAEITSVGRKFFKSRPVQHTYYKRRQNF